MGEKIARKEGKRRDFITADTPDRFISLKRIRSSFGMLDIFFNPDRLSTCVIIFIHFFFFLHSVEFEYLGNFTQMRTKRGLTNKFLKVSSEWGTGFEGVAINNNFRLCLQI